MNKINNLIFHLLALQGLCKNVHYNVPDYSVHLLSDKIQDNLNDFIDELKENCLLAKGVEPLSSATYFVEASKLINDVSNLHEIKLLIIDNLVILEQMSDLSLGDEDLLGKIGSDLQNSLGILNIILKEKNNV